MAPKKQRAITITLAAAGIAALAGCTSPFSHASGPASTHRTVAASPSGSASAVSGRSAAAGKAAGTGTVTTTDKTATAGKTAVKAGPRCPGQEAWSLRAATRVKALYADTGALAADASADNQPAIVKAGRALAADALAAATLALPPADPSGWKTLTTAYATAGTALADGDTARAIPALETGNSAMSVFSGAVAACLADAG